MEKCEIWQSHDEMLLEIYNRYKDSIMILLADMRARG